MIKEVKAQGFKNFMEVVESPEFKGKTIYCLFCGDKDASGKSWCPDCVVSEPIVRRCLENVDDPNAVFVHCQVGGRDYWKDSSNEFRTHSQLKLTGVPTFFRWGHSKKRLVESQLKEELISMLLLEDE